MKSRTLTTPGQLVTARRTDIVVADWRSLPWIVPESTGGVLATIRLLCEQTNAKQVIASHFAAARLVITVTISVMVARTNVVRFQKLPAYS